MAVAQWTTLLSLTLASAAAPRPAPWRVTELARSTQSGWSSAQTLAYHDAVAFRAAWAQLFPAQSSRPALPTIDFTKWRVIIVAMGTEPTGGYTMSLDSGRVVRDSALVEVTLHMPGKNCGVTEQLTRPAVAIGLPIVPAAFRIMIHQRADSVHCN